MLAPIFLQKSSVYVVVQSYACCGYVLVNVLMIPLFQCQCYTSSKHAFLVCFDDTAYNALLTRNSACKFQLKAQPCALDETSRFRATTRRQNTPFIAHFGICPKFAFRSVLPFSHKSIAFVGALIRATTQGRPYGGRMGHPQITNICLASRTS